MVEREWQSRGVHIMVARKQRVGEKGSRDNIPPRTCPQ
jgi:hypothetical protein